MGGCDKEKQHSISPSEMSTISFVVNHSRTPTYSRRMVYDYLDYTDIISNYIYDGKLMYVRNTDNQLVYEPGITIVPSHALRNSAARIGIKDDPSSQDLMLSELISRGEVRVKSDSRNKMYTNGNNEILYRGR